VVKRQGKFWNVIMTKLLMYYLYDITLVFSCWARCCSSGFCCFLLINRNITLQNFYLLLILAFV